MAEESDSKHDCRNKEFLLFDEITPRGVDWHFSIDGIERLRPQKNDFQLLHFIPMSNDLGERWALVTVKNTSKGHRFLKNEHLVATFANGSQTIAVLKSERIPGEGMVSRSVFFGTNKFPIVMVEIE